MLDEVYKVVCEIWMNLNDGVNYTSIISSGNKYMEQPSFRATLIM